MSAGGDVIDRDLDKLAPRFREAVEEAVAACRVADLDAMVWEAYRSDELQRLYYQRGRPPTPLYPRTVTNARSNLYSWHGYGLAVDVISQRDKWFNPDPAKVRALEADQLALRAYLRARDAEGDQWFAAVAAVFRAHECDWGGDWIKGKADPPHIQWGRLKPSPSDRAREIIAAGGMEAVWTAVGAA